MYIKVVGAAVNAAVIAYHLADNGHQVIWQTCDVLLSQMIENNDILFDDYELTHCIQKQLLTQNLKVNDAALDIHCNILIIAVNNDQYIAFDKLFKNLADQHYDLVINYSNLGLGKSLEIQQSLGQSQIAYIPDFLKEGALLSSFCTRNLIVGCDSEEKHPLIREIFRPIFPLKQQVNFMSLSAAEFTKLSISGFLATKISYMNDLSNVAENLGIDIEEVRVAMSMDDRIGEQYLYPGCGFGGNNFTRDILKLKEVVLASGNSNGLLDKIWDINENQKEIVFRKIWKLFDCDLKGKVIGIWGAAFKPNINSVSNSPVLKVLEACWSQGAITQIHDPRALLKLKELYPDQPLLKICDDAYQAAEGADVLCLMTEWKQYWSPNYPLLARLMRQRNIIDGRNIYNPLYAENQGFHYIGIGR